MNEIPTAFDNYIFEKLHLKLCKSILGVHSKANNTAVRGELGRHPLIFFVLKSAIKYWVRLQTLENKDSLLNKTFKENEDLVASRKKCWLINVQSIYQNTIKQDNWNKIDGNLKHLRESFTILSPTTLK